MNLQKKWINRLLFIEVIALVCVCVFGVFSGNKDTQSDSKQIKTEVKNENAEEKADSESFKETEETEKYSVPTEIVVERVTFSEEIEEKLSQMTLEQKIAQMFLITPEALTGVSEVVTAGDASMEALQAYPVGGLEFSTKNYEYSEQFSGMIAGLQSYSNEIIGTDLFIAVKESGGESYSPFAEAGMYETQPSVAELGQNLDFEAARVAASTISAAFETHGINMNLVLVADLRTGISEEYDQYTFGSDPETVGNFVTSQMLGYKENGVTAVLRGFPGYSYAERGADGSGIFVSSRTLEEMQINELTVYQAGIDAGAEAILIANMTAEGLTGDSTTPCSFSGATTNYLRNDMGYAGVIISGDLSNTRISAIYDSAAAAVAAVKAGMDIIYNPVDFVVAYDAVVNAVNTGEIDEILIDNAVGRILTLKNKY